MRSRYKNLVLCAKKYGIMCKNTGQMERKKKDPLLCGFSKNVTSKEKVKLWFFVTFNIVLRHIFPENFIEFPQDEEILCQYWLIFIDFHRVFGFFDSQQFFTFNIL